MTSSRYCGPSLIQEVDLRKRGSAKPRTVRTLTSTISALFLKQLSSDEIGSLLEALKELGYVSVSGTKVSYNLPT